MLVLFFPKRVPSKKRSRLQVLSGMVVIELENLVPGRHYDVYCYSETYVPPSSSGIDTAPRFGMDADAILETRHLLITQGPFFDDLGWFCVSGRPCNVTDLLGFHLAENDQLFVRPETNTKRHHALAHFQGKAGGTMGWNAKVSLTGRGPNICYHHRGSKWVSLGVILREMGSCYSGPLEQLGLPFFWDCPVSLKNQPQKGYRQRRQTQLFFLCFLFSFQTTVASQSKPG